MIARTALSDVQRSTAGSGGFIALDDALLAATQGVFLVQSADASGAKAVLAHAGRRVSALGRRQLSLLTLSDASLWRDVAARLGLAELSSDIEQAARSIEDALRATRACVVGTTQGASSWDQTLTRLLLRRGLASQTGALLVLHIDADVSILGAESQMFSVDADLDASGLERWWGAIASEGLRRVSQPTATPLRGLESWWGRAVHQLVPGQLRRQTRHTEHERTASENELLSRLNESELRSLVRLTLAARPWPSDRAGLLGQGLLAGVRGLEDQGWVQVRDGVIALIESVSVDRASDVDRREVISALSEAFALDPWANSRVARLFAEMGEIERAEQAHIRAIELADDTTARSDLWVRWAHVVASLPAEQRRECSLRAAELALAHGDADEALSWAERAVALGPDALQTSLILGRASLGRGDLLTAGVALEKALRQAEGNADRAKVLAEVAEVRYSEGKLDEALKLAREAIVSAADMPTRLRAQNTEGKLLLARGAWAEAESHFARDELEAGCHGDAMGRLRARVNRAVAILSDGRSEEAAPMLESVLNEGRETRELRAVAFALSNLAVLAINRHDYGEALRLSEEAIDVRRRMGERQGLARVVTNLAELRLRLGLVAEAEQTLAFGQQAVSRRAPLPRSAHFSLMSARVQLARGDTLNAMRELSAALAGAASSSDGDMHNECLRLSVRISLEDGDVERASRDIESASAKATTPAAQAELKLLAGMLARSKGDLIEAAALSNEAVLQSRRACDEELLREAHTLCAEIALASQSPADARYHVGMATQLKQRVVSSLAPSLASSYLSRRDLVRLGRLESELNEMVPAPPSSSAETLRTPKARSSRSMVGSDPAIRALQIAIKKVARADSTVLVHGESGTGKELVAEAIHEMSDRREGPLVRVNCAALVESLLLSELFGHEKGSFTGASARKRGRFEVADGGTLFLDEIGDISPRTQVALLRVLQERTFERVGGTCAIQTNVRIVCATHRDLKAMVERGEFRQDLYFRLSGLVLEVPALRSRLGDLPLLAQALLDRIAVERSESSKSLSTEAMSLLARHRWPGNIRELENALRAASLFAEGEVITASDLSEHVESLRGLPSATQGPGSGPVSIDIGLGDDDDAICEDGAVPSGDAEATDRIYQHLKLGKAGLFDVKRQIERDCIARALAETRGNITRAAAILGMKRPRLSQLVKQYGLSVVSSEGS